MMMKSVYQTHRHAMSRNAQAGDYDVRTALNAHTEQANLLLYTMIFGVEQYVSLWTYWQIGIQMSI